MVLKLLSNQKGMALIQGLFLAAAVAGIAYVGTKLSIDQKLVQKTAESRDAVEQLHNLIYNILQNQDHCTATINGVGISAGGTAKLSKITTLDGITAFEVNKSTTYDATKMYMNNKVALQDITIQFASPLSGPSKLDINYARLEKDNAARKSGAGYGGSSVTKSLTFLVQQDDKGLYHCYAIQHDNKDLSQTFCKELAHDNDPTTDDSFFEWDPDNNLCRLKDLSCPPGKINAGFDSNGKARCNDIIEWMDIYDILDNSNPMECADSAKVEFEIVGNQKVRLKCETPCLPQPGQLSGWKYDACTGPTTTRRKTCDSAPSCRGTPCPPDQVETAPCPSYVPPVIPPSTASSGSAAAGSTSSGATTSAGTTSAGTTTSGSTSAGVPNPPNANTGGTTSAGSTSGTSTTGTPTTGTTGCTPVNGQWSAGTPSAWGACSNGQQSRVVNKVCDAPTPTCGGAACAGSAQVVEFQSCATTPSVRHCLVIYNTDYLYNPVGSSSGGGFGDGTPTTTCPQPSSTEQWLGYCNGPADCGQYNSPRQASTNWGTCQAFSSSVAICMEKPAGAAGGGGGGASGSGGTGGN